MKTQDEKLYNVLSLAQQYGVNQALSKCVSLLQSNITVRSACMALNLAPKLLETESVQALVTSSKYYLVSQFGNLLQAIHRPEFLDLSVSALVGILENDEHMVPIDSENTVLYAVLLWLSHGEDRKQYAKTLINHVRFPLLRRYYLLSVPFMLKGLDPETKLFVDELHNEALVFKVGGSEWVKARGIPSSSTNPKRFQLRNSNSTTVSNTFVMTDKFTGASKWVVDKPHWSETYFSNGYSLQFYVCRSAGSFGVYLHVFSQFIPADEFCLPLSFTIFLLHKSGQFDRIRPCKTTFRRTASKGMPNLGVNHEDYIVNNTVTVKIEVTFENLDQ